MIKKLNNLNFINFKNSDNLDKVECFFVDFKTGNNEQKADVYSKTMNCGVIALEHLEEIPEAIEILFIQKLNEILKKEQIINIDKKFLEDKSLDIIASTITKFMKELETKRKNQGRKTINSFIFSSKDFFDKNALFNNNIIMSIIKYSEELDNEIIFGYKTDVDEPGLILVTNEEGLKDKNNIRIGLFSIGFFPEKSYYKIKII